VKARERIGGRLRNPPFKRGLFEPSTHSMALAATVRKSSTLLPPSISYFNGAGCNLSGPSMHTRHGKRPNSQISKAGSTWDQLTLPEHRNIRARSSQKLARQRSRRCSTFDVAYSQVHETVCPQLMTSCSAMSHF